METRKMPKLFIIFWVAVIVAYTVWMTAFMPTIVLDRYEQPDARIIAESEEIFNGRQNGVAVRTETGEKGETVYYVEHKDITGMIGRHWLYPVWVVLSVLSLAVFPLLLKKILYGEPGKGVAAVCMILLIAAFIFDTVYAFLGDYTVIQKAKNVTASMLGLDYPWSFRLWGVLTSLAVYANIALTFRRFDYAGKVPLLLGSVGSAAIYMTINLPSLGLFHDFSVPRCLYHWVGALLFAFLCATPLAVVLCVKMRQKLPHFKAAFIFFMAIVVVMTSMLVLIGKSALIENLPVWAAFILMYILNFTDYFLKGKRKAEETAKETAAV